ncbi:MAG: hypothetical protein JO254_06530, partial [Pseudolabrys sp.]|nr:hypothetical protein [Pseudolabrys sp.]
MGACTPLDHASAHPGPDCPAPVQDAGFPEASFSGLALTQAIRLSNGSAARRGSDLAGEMAARWRAGEPPLAEEFFARVPELERDPEAAVALIVEEICLRQEHGEKIVSTELMRRFPQWQSQLEVLLDCQRFVSLHGANELPAAGDCLGDFVLLSQLGRGAQGQVFLARHQSLAHRPVVLKITQSIDEEHLSLARLQHTHIVPLYTVERWPGRGLRALVFPYLGRVTWHELLRRLRPVPLQQRTGKHVLEILDKAEDPGLLSPDRAMSPARRLLERETYVQA